MEILQLSENTFSFQQPQWKLNKTTEEALYMQPLQFLKLYLMAEKHCQFFPCNF